MLLSCVFTYSQAENIWQIIFIIITINISFCVIPFVISLAIQKNKRRICDNNITEIKENNETV